jgi:FemAB family protein
MNKKRKLDFKTEDFLKTISHLAHEINFKLIFDKNDNANWNYLEDNCSYFPLAYSKENILYQIEYQESQGGNWYDLSCIIMWGDEIAGAWPITISQDDNLYTRISSQGQSILPPLFSNKINQSARREISSLCFEFIKRICEHYSISGIDFSDPFTNSSSLSEWNFRLSELYPNCEIHHDLYLEIHGSIDDILLRFKKKLRYEIKKAFKLWNSDILTSHSSREDLDSIWQEFQNLHFNASGRMTRSVQSWKLQKQMIIADVAFLVFLRNEEGQMIGGGFFTFTKDEALYAVAAYDRSLFKMPLGHLVQYIAIEHFVQRKIKWYKLGTRPQASKKTSPSLKELDIGKFKKQFSSHSLPRYEFRLNNQIVANETQEQK